MIRTVIVLLFVFISIFVTSAEFVHPHYTYSCEENKDIIIRGINEGGLVNITSATNPAKCPKTIITVDITQQARINKSCTTQDTYNEYVKITVFDPVFDNKSYTPAPTSAVATKLIGGHLKHSFHLKCNAIPASGVLRTAEHQMHINDEEIKEDTYFEVKAVQMKFRRSKQKDSEDISSVYTGDAFYMFLEYTGATPYFVHPKQCIARKGNAVDKAYDNNTDILLWDTGCLKKDAKSLMEDFVTVEHYAYAKIYGFHFTTSNDLSIICNVTVCNCSKPTKGCQSAGGSSGGGGNSKRKRSIFKSHPMGNGQRFKRSIQDSRHYIAKVARTIKVYDEISGSSIPRASWWIQQIAMFTL